jgi:DUF971 family protein
MKPARVEIINDFLAIVWDDGQESFLDFKSLRVACPCAGCKGERTVMREFKPLPPVYTAESFQMTGYQFIGGYALQFSWRDGHNSGIYTFDYLRNLENQP